MSDLFDRNMSMEQCSDLEVLANQRELDQPFR